MTVSVPSSVSPILGFWPGYMAIMYVIKLYDPSKTESQQPTWLLTEVTYIFDIKINKVFAIFFIGETMRPVLLDFYQ